MVSTHDESASRPGPVQRTTSFSSASSIAPRSSGPSRIRRRNRLITSCLECRRRKLKCDKSHPCTNCTKHVRDCIYLALAFDSASQSRLTEIKDKMGALEKTLEKDAARRSSISGPRPSFDAFGELDEDDELEPEEPEDERDLRTTPDGYLDAAYDEDADDDLLDLGFMMGKVRITERIGGYVHPRLEDEINNHLEYAANSGPPFAQPPDVPSRDSYFKPGVEYIVPTSSFFFAPHPPRSSLIDFLPSKIAADRLMTQYWSAVHPLARIVHRPSFQRQYDYFWQSFASGFEPPPSQQAAVFAALFSAAVSMSDNAVMQGFGVSKVGLVDNLRVGTETALANANFLKTTKLETVQALVMYLIPQCRGEVSRAHSALTGLAIRLAECMSLHRDGTQYGLSPVEVHVRRLIWYQLCFLDVRTCEATGPRPQIAAEHFDTQLPLNANDSNLESPSFTGEDAPYWTEMTLTRIRFECNRMHRLIWFERPRVDARQMTLTALLSKVEKFRRDMERKYHGMFDESVPIQRFAKHLMNSLTVKAHVMVLSRYRRTDTNHVPDRIRQLTLTAAIMQVESSVVLETTASFKLWWWYTGAFQQYHSAVLLLLELYENPDMPEAGRIWACLDYVFETVPNMSGREKAKSLLLELCDRSRIYNSRRKLKVPVTDQDRQRRSPLAADEASRHATTRPGGGDLTRRLSSPSQHTSPPRFVPPAVEQPAAESHRAIFGMYTMMPRTSPGGMTRSDFNFSNLSSVPPSEGPNPITNPNTNPTANPSSQPEFSLPMQTTFPWNPPGIGSSSSHYSSAPSTSQFALPPPLPPPSLLPPPAPSNQNFAGGGSGGGAGGTGNINDVMADIDWHEWDELFPANNTGTGTGTEYLNATNFNFGAEGPGGARS